MVDLSTLQDISCLRLGMKSVHVQHEVVQVTVQISLQPTFSTLKTCMQAAGQGCELQLLLLASNTALCMKCITKQLCGHTKHLKHSHLVKLPTGVQYDIQESCLWHLHVLCAEPPVDA